MGEANTGHAAHGDASCGPRKGEGNIFCSDCADRDWAYRGVDQWVVPMALLFFEGGVLRDVRRANGSNDVGLAEEMGAGLEPLCEVGIGTNQWAPPWQIGTIYEKSAGTIHVAVGGNAHFGGLRDSPRHMDLIVRQPTLKVDGTPLALPPGLWHVKEDT